MPIITVLLRLALAAIFGAAGVTKLSDQPGTQVAVKNFGAPEPVAPIVAILLPIAELVIAVGFLFANTAGVSALAGFMLLLVFMVAISINLVRGNTHDCHCFGQLYSRPLGWPTLVRNVVFAAAALFVYWQAKVGEIPGIAATLADLSLNQLLWLIGVVLFLTALLVYALRNRKQTPAATAPKPQGLPPGSVAPPFELNLYQGGTVSLEQLLAPGKPVLLIFTSPTCGPCVVLFAEIKKWQDAHSDHLTIGLLSFGTIKENFVNVARNQLGQLLLQQKREVAEMYGANVTPTAVIVDREGKIASQVAAGADEIRRLLETLLGTELAGGGQRAADRDQRSEVQGQRSDGNLQLEEN